MTVPRRLLLVLVLALVVAACGDDDVSSGALIDLGDGGSYSPDLDPADFVQDVDNPYLPLVRGSRWVYEGEGDDGIEQIEVEVTDQRQEVLGISAVVVHRSAQDADGTVLEETFAWFAQDVDGNVWSLGEDITTYEDGEAAGAEGSWEAGVDGAQPGIAMRADPDVGDAYRQEYLRGKAEHMAMVQDLSAALEVPTGSYEDVLVVEEWSPLDPDVVQEAYHAPGVGVVLQVTAAGGDDRFELVEFEGA